MKNLGQMMKQAQEMQVRMQEMQDKLEQMEVEGASGGGMVRITMTAKGAARSVQIDPTLFESKDAEMLEDLIVAAVNDAKTKAETVAADEMKELTGGLSLPPGFKLPF